MTSRRSLARAGAGAVLTVGAVMISATGALASPTLVGDDGPGLSVVETLGLYVLAPVALFALIALVVLGPSIGKGGRSRGATAPSTEPTRVDPAGSHRAAAPTHAARAEAGGATTEQGGASGRW